MLKIYRDLFSNLNEQVLYTAWKDCNEIKENVMGIGDIDLLVQENPIFLRILSAYGFIRATNRTLNFPSVYHYYGYDETSSLICHLNIYYKIITGPSHTKSHHLPFEVALLANRKLNQYGIYEASFQDQNVMYYLRHHLKRSSPWGLYLWRREYLSYIQENKYIKGGLKLELCDDKYNLGDDSLIKSFNEIGKIDHGQSLRGIYTDFKVTQNLSKYRRKNRIYNYLASINNMKKQAVLRVFKKRKQISQGIVIAISGIDGSGKSTLVKDLHHLFIEHFDTHLVHIGKPNATLITFIFRIPLKVRLFLKGIRKKIPTPVYTDGHTVNNYSLIYGLRFLVLGYERYSLCKKIKNKADKGCVVLTDRYIGEEIGKMDSPRLGVKRGGILGVLGKLEYYLYKNAPRADVLFYLDVSIENLIARNEKRTKKGKETKEEIILRYKINSGASISANEVVKIDANRTYEEVLAEVKHKAWLSIEKKQDI
jgi:thymidylate kinase